jgi:hypothetical protein
MLAPQLSTQSYSAKTTAATCHENYGGEQKERVQEGDCHEDEASRGEKCGHQESGPQYAACRQVGRRLWPQNLERWNRSECVMNGDAAEKKQYEGDCEVLQKHQH